MRIEHVKAALIGIALFPGIAFYTQAQDTVSTLVKVDGGLVEGSVEDGIAVYRGIPYAAPPVGDLRWRAPRPVEPWEGVLEAREFCPACPQPSNLVTSYFTKYGISEDCLALNIWKPANSAGEKLPVLVWIHGGGFNMGSTSQDLLSGEQLARKGVIVVSMGYRLGALGYLAHPALSEESPNGVSGNYGILDQIAALEWVRRNIAAFGGDPGCVTLMGQSAGGQSVSILAASPLAGGLFHRVISMSGGYFRPASDQHRPEFTQTLKGAEADGLKLVEEMGAKSLEELRALDPGAFLDRPLDQLDYWPVIDGYVIPDDLYKLYSGGDYNDVPVLLGNTSGEGSIFNLTANPGQYADSARNNFGPFADQVLKKYPAGEEALNRQSMGELLRDTYFSWPAWTWATLQTKTGGSQVYAYYFDQPQPASALTMLLRSTGAYHGSDCAYVFGHLDQDPGSNFTEEDHRLSELMMDYWIRFARYGDPNGPGMPLWPAFNPENPEAMILKGKPGAGPLPNLDRLKLIDAYFTWKREE